MLKHRHELAASNTNPRGSRSAALSTPASRMQSKKFSLRNTVLDNFMMVKLLFIRYNIKNIILIQNIIYHNLLDLMNYY